MAKIICYIDSIGAGGAQRQLIGLAKQLKSKGYDVIICVYTDIPFYLQDIRRENIEYKYLSKAVNKLFRIYHTYKFIKQEKPDCVVAFLETPSIIMCLIKMIYKKFKLIVSERNTTQKITNSVKLRFSLFRQE